ncbi:glycosyltransferase [Pseudonocardia sp. NPDC049154]|uniref:glycosyltransferase family 2 protein n=1 Tax=Pseudonocardia sp. NPDC049154 TaxID=3155501 RepID=UPI00340FF637
MSAARSPERHRHRRPKAANRAVIRALVVLTLALGVNYVVWRWLESVNWSFWWIAVPLVIAETYSLVDAFLFGITMWRVKERGEPPSPSPDATVDVFITTYNEPIDMVMTTARAARGIRFPHRTWVLDDGARPEMRAAAEEAGVGYLTRDPSWENMPRHAKAGNLNNALMQTDGEFLMILDADQIPEPEILDRTLGWFRDPEVALVQTPQFFTNVTASDPLGSQAPLFYGPIQKGKDGWNAAFFCGSNAVLRREALMQLGLAEYVRQVERSLRQVLRTSDSLLSTARREAAGQGPEVRVALDKVSEAVGQARRELGSPRSSFSEVTYRFRQRVDEASRGVVDADVAALARDLEELGEIGPHGASGDEHGRTDGRNGQPGPAVLDEEALARLSTREMSPLNALSSVRALVDAVDVSRADEAQPIMPMATLSVTEDMATAMRLHGMGWRSVYHHEILAKGLAPEDLGTMLHQRLRWAQGTLQVMLKENPLVQKGLAWGQRLMYLATMWSYLSGFFAVVYLVAPVVFLCFDIRPVVSYGPDFLVRLIPYLVFNQLLFLVIGYGKRTWRGTQYSLALFPLWIRATWTAFANVFFGRPLGFVVTPKTRQTRARPPWRLVWPQLTAMALLALSAVVGTLRYLLGMADFDLLSLVVNLFWVLFDLVILSVVISAATYTGPESEEQKVAQTL